MKVFKGLINGTHFHETISGHKLYNIFTKILQNYYGLEELLNAVTGQCFNARASNAELGSNETFLASLFIAFHM